MNSMRQYKIRLLQFAACIFFLNAATAYGTCCFKMPMSDTSPVTEMPCQQNDDNAGTSNADNCILCVSLLVSFCEKADHPIDEAAIVVTTTPALITNSISPPFRPPIIFLS